MIQLKEALINKNNAKNTRQHYPEKYLFCPNSYLYYTVIRDKEMEEKQAPAYKCAYAWYLTDKDLVKHEYWIDYCKKEIPRLGWWAGKIHTDSRQKAKKMLLRCQELEDVIEKIDGPSAI